MSAWTDESKSTLRRMWGDGDSAESIACALCSGVFQPSRFAVIGMAHRMELGEHSYKTEHRQQRVVNRRKQTERARLTQEIKAQRLLANAEHKRRHHETRGLMRAAKNAEQRVLAERAAAEMLSLSEEKPTRTVMTIGADECRWPIGEVGDHDFGFCGARARVGSYCARHAAAAISGNQQREAARVSRVAMRGFKQ